MTSVKPNRSTLVVVSEVGDAKGPNAVLEVVRERSVAYSILISIAHGDCERTCLKKRGTLVCRCLGLLDVILVLAIVYFANPTLVW